MDLLRDFLRVEGSRAGDGETDREDQLGIIIQIINKIIIQIINKILIQIINKIINKIMIRMRG